MADPIETKTWATAEVLDAPDMNNYIRDNFDYMRSRTIKAFGRTGYTLVSGGGVTTSRAVGTTSFGVTFTATPVVIGTVESQDLATADLEFTLMGAPTTTTFKWLVSTNRSDAVFTTSGFFAWIAIGTVA